jgi:hypothetical protein
MKQKLDDNARVFAPVRNDEIAGAIPAKSILLLVQRNVFICLNIQTYCEYYGETYNDNT